MSCGVSNYLYSGFDCVFLSRQISVLEWTYTLQLPECQGTLCSKQVQYLTLKWLQLVSNPQPLSLLTNTQPFSKTGLTLQMIWLCSEFLFVCYIWLCHLITHTHFRVNPHCWCLNVIELLAGNKCTIWNLNDFNRIRTQSLKLQILCLF